MAFLSKTLCTIRAIFGLFEAFYNLTHFLFRKIEYNDYNDNVKFKNQTKKCN